MHRVSKKPQIFACGAEEPKKRGKRGLVKPPRPKMTAGGEKKMGFSRGGGIGRRSVQLKILKILEKKQQ